MFQKRLYVYDDRRWFRNPVYLLFIGFGLLIVPRYFSDGVIWEILHSIGALAFWGVFLFRTLFGNSCTVGYKYINFKAINGRLLVNRDRIDEVWTEGQKLNLRRINRVDELDFTGVPKEKFNRMVSLVTDSIEQTTESTNKVSHV